MYERKCKEPYKGCLNPSLKCTRYDMGEDETRTCDTGVEIMRVILTAM